MFLSFFPFANPIILINSLYLGIATVSSVTNFIDCLPCSRCLLVYRCFAIISILACMNTVCSKSYVLFFQSNLSSSMKITVFSRSVVLICPVQLFSFLFISWLPLQFPTVFGIGHFVSLGLFQIFYMLNLQSFQCSLHEDRWTVCRRNRIG